MRYYISPPPMNPVARVLTTIVGLLMLATAFFFGLIVLAVVLGIGALFAVIMWVRIWWARRHHSAPEEPPKGQAHHAEVIEAEYTVVSKRRD